MCDCDFNSNAVREECEAVVTEFITVMNETGMLWHNEYGGTIAIEHPTYTYRCANDTKVNMVIINEVLYFKVLPNNNMEFIPNDSTIYDGYFISDEMDHQNVQVRRCLYAVEHECSIQCGQTTVNMYI